MRIIFPSGSGNSVHVYTGDSAKDQMRFQILKDQLAYYKKYNVSWCIWLYKDLGLQAVLSQKKATPYMQLISSFLAKKDSLGADRWGATDKNIRPVMAPIEALMKNEFPAYNPYPSGMQTQINVAVRHILFAEALEPEYCNLFSNLSDEQVSRLHNRFALRTMSNVSDWKIFYQGTNNKNHLKNYFNESLCGMTCPPSFAEGITS